MDEPIQTFLERMNVLQNQKTFFHPHPPSILTAEA